MTKQLARFYLSEKEVKRFLQSRNECWICDKICNQMFMDIAGQFYIRNDKRWKKWVDDCIEKHIEQIINRTFIFYT